MLGYGVLESESVNTTSCRPRRMRRASQGNGVAYQVCTTWGGESHEYKYLNKDVMRAAVGQQHNLSCLCSCFLLVFNLLAGSHDHRDVDAFCVRRSNLISRDQAPTTGIRADGATFRGGERL